MNGGYPHGNIAYYAGPVAWPCGVLKKYDIAGLTLTAFPIARFELTLTRH